VTHDLKRVLATGFRVKRAIRSSVLTEGGGDWADWGEGEGDLGETTLSSPTGCRGGGGLGDNENNTV